MSVLLWASSNCFNEPSSYRLKADSICCEQNLFAQGDWLEFLRVAELPNAAFFLSLFVHAASCIALLFRAMTASGTLSRKVLQFDGGFLLLAGGAAMIIETVGHFLGVGPFAQSKGSPYTIGAFKAHGLAIIFAVLLIRAASLSERSLWHRVGLIVHLLLGCSNLLFWSSFVQLNVLLMGVITTVLHIVFVIAHGICLQAAKRVRK